jgi:Rieske Fe-S protein
MKNRIRNDQPLVKNKRKIKKSSKLQRGSGKSKRVKKTQNNKKSNKNKKLECPQGMTELKTPKGLLCVGRCPHSGGPIYYNPKTDKLVCKWHGSQFDPNSGKVLTPPAQSSVKIIKKK